VDRLAGAGVSWVPHPFGRPGGPGGAGRVARGARAVRGAPLVHARSDLPAASAVAARSPAWLWDVRSFWADQRIALGALRPGSAEERVLRRVERAAARRCGAIITLTRAAIPVLADRHGPDVAAKARVVTTCVDLERFALRPPPDPDPVRLLLSGTLNAFYDVPAMIGLARAVAALRPARLDVLAPGTTPWHAELEAAGAEIGRATFAEMPDRVAAHHAGLSICRLDAGISLAAAAPTKLGEFLACGRPVVVNRGLGDMAELVAAYDCGVTVDDVGPAALEAAAVELCRLLDDPGVGERCRALAEAHFDLDTAVASLVTAYRTMTG